MPDNRIIPVALISLAVGVAAGWFLFSHPSAEVAQLRKKNSDLQAQLEDIVRLNLPVKRRAGELDEVLQAMPLGDEARYDRLMQAGSARHLGGDFDGAIWEFTKAALVKPDGFDAYLNRGVVYQEQQKWGKALADYRLAATLNPGEPASWNNLAMLLAACPEDSLRDGETAVQHAQKACELSDWKHPGMLNTLAVAYAEKGDFAAAADMQRQAIELLGQAGPAAEDFTYALELFEQRKPYRLRESDHEPRQ